MQSLIMPQFLTQQQCDELIELGRPTIKRSTSYTIADGNESVSDHRTSEHTFLYRDMNPLVSSIAQMVAYQTAFPVENQEGIQIAHYVPGTYFKPHFDYFDPRFAGAKKTLDRGGQRVVTFMVYLNTIPEGFGGETHFDLCGVSVRPEMGKACMWYNLYPDRAVNPFTRHEGRTPKEPYEKWIATIWVRERNFT